ncbi:hypothetical protein JIN84_06560 [Luteolibacter yonseiensis]|uniref:Uncharacterized protein n=1 Tax=Luteolibacter yonseiensis TaxID=1144680 RepID=A0A934R2J4_9BACT|nr:hypothetical protein [Luteolibacter yonseiensis]MBK1815267.1 hypothetical protein [Luteolibacter yonseiensis]
MSTTTKKASSKGIRYTDEQKKEVIDFAVNYNAANGRGGQSKAAEKFNISQLTVASWLKSVKAPKAAKAPKEAKAKAPKAAADGRGKKSRYSDDQKKEVTDFVVAYNAANGRGGASTASKKFGISPLTVVAWLGAAGVSSKGGKKAAPAKASKAAKAPKAAVVSGGLNAKLTSLLALSNQIDKAEAELAKLKSRFASLKAAL